MCSKLAFSKETFEYTAHTHTLAHSCSVWETASEIQMQMIMLKWRRWLDRVSSDGVCARLMWAYDSISLFSLNKHTHTHMLFVLYATISDAHVNLIKSKRISIEKAINYSIRSFSPVSDYPFQVFTCRFSSVCVLFCSLRDVRTRAIFLLQLWMMI